MPGIYDISGILLAGFAISWGFSLIGWGVSTMLGYCRGSSGGRSSGI